MLLALYGAWPDDNFGCWDIKWPRRPERSYRLASHSKGVYEAQNNNAPFMNNLNSSRVTVDGFTVFLLQTVGCYYRVKFGILHYRKIRP